MLLLTGNIGLLSKTNKVNLPITSIAPYLNNKLSSGADSSSIVVVGCITLSKGFVPNATSDGAL